MPATLKNNRDFQKTYRKGKFKAGRFLVVYAKNNGLEINRIGISVGKRFGNSVQRNRIKRLIRESFRKYDEKVLKGYDFVVSVKAAKKVSPGPNQKLKAEYVPTLEEVSTEIYRALIKMNLTC